MSAFLHWLSWLATQRGVVVDMTRLPGCVPDGSSCSLYVGNGLQAFLIACADTARYWFFLG